MENIKIFNSIWYRDCFFHGILQIAHNFGCSDRIFENDYFAYEYKENDGIPELSFDVKGFLPWQELLIKNGVMTDIRFIERDLVSEVCEVLDAGGLVMIPVDCFYEDIRSDCYGKIHLVHYIVTYGYDKDREEFLVLEHNYLNDLRYREQRIKFDIMRRANKGFAEERGLERSKLFTFFKADADAKLADKNIFEGLGKWKDSFCEFERFFTEFKKLATVEFLSKNSWRYKDMFEKIYNIKKYQKYYYDNILRGYLSDATHEIDRLLADIPADDCGIIMGMFGRAMLTGDVSEDTLDRVLMRLEKIYEREEQACEDISLIQHCRT